MNKELFEKKKKLEKQLEREKGSLEFRKEDFEVQQNRVEALEEQIARIDEALVEALEEQIARIDEALIDEALHEEDLETAGATKEERKAEGGL